MDKILLNILLWLVKTFGSKDIDFYKLKVITETKLLMDRRRTPANWKRKQQKEMKNPMLFTLIAYAVIGLFIGFLVYAVPLLMGMITIHAYLLFMMAMTLVTDFSTVLLDTTDNQIILPKPVSSRTLFMSRVVHILTYLLQFMIAIVGCPLVFIFAKYGLLTGFACVITMLLTVAFAVFLTYLLYALILRYADEQKVKDVIGYFQVFMTVFFAVGYQIVPRFIDMEALKLTIHLHWYSYLLPPVWMAVSLEAVHEMNIDHIHLLNIAAAVFVPILTVWFMIKFLAPSFSKKLGALSGSTDVKKKNTRSGKQSKSISEKLSNFFCRSKTETAGFEKVWKITSRDKNFKVQFYPGYAYILVFLFIFIFKNGSKIGEVWTNLPNTKMFLAFIYMPLMSVSGSLNIIPFNENFAAAWIYQSSPLVKPGEIISGSVKAIIVKFFLPVYVIIISFALYIWGNTIIDDCFFGLFNNLLIFMIMVNIMDHYLPFSQQQNVKQQSGKFLRIILQLVLIAALIYLHYLALKISWLPLALVPVSAIGTYFLLKRIQDLPWVKISI